MTNEMSNLSYVCNIVFCGASNMEEFHLKWLRPISGTINLHNTASNVTKMSLHFSSIDSAAPIQNLINRCPKLNDLSVIIDSKKKLKNFRGDFIKDGIEKFEWDTAWDLFNNNEDLLLSLIRTQKKIRVLKCRNVLSTETYEAIFRMCTNLEELSLDRNGSIILFKMNIEQIGSMSNLKHYEDTSESINAAKLFTRLPSITTLKASALNLDNEQNQEQELNNSKVVFPYLTELKLDFVVCFNLRNFSAPKLLRLHIIKLARYDPYFAIFLKNIEKVEDLTIESLSSVDNVKEVVADLSKQSSIKNIKIRHMIGIDHPYNIDEDERVGENAKLYKILINIEAKTVKVSSYIYRKCKDVMLVLKNLYPDFRFIVFCY